MYVFSQDFWDRQEAYLRRCFKFHNEALTELTNYVPLPAGQVVNTKMEDIKT